MRDCLLGSSSLSSELSLGLLPRFISFALILALVTVKLRRPRLRVMLTLHQAQVRDTQVPSKKGVRCLHRVTIVSFITKELSIRVYFWSNSFTIDVLYVTENNFTILQTAEL